MGQEVNAMAYNAYISLNKHTCQCQTCKNSNSRIEVEPKPQYYKLHTCWLYRKGLLAILSTRLGYTPTIFAMMLGPIQLA